MSRHIHVHLPAMDRANRRFRDANKFEQAAQKTREQLEDLQVELKNAQRREDRTRVVSVMNRISALRKQLQYQEGQASAES